jgi:hypothetical protein
MDNAVGSLTQLQRSVIIGSILGDGYVRIVPGRKDAFLEVNHSIKLSYNPVETRPKFIKGRSFLKKSKN